MLSNNILERNTTTNVITIRAGRDYETNELVEVAYKMMQRDILEEVRKNVEKVLKQKNVKSESQPSESQPSESQPRKDMPEEELEPGDEFDLDEEPDLDEDEDEDDDFNDGMDLVGTVSQDGNIYVLSGKGSYVTVSKFPNLRMHIDETDRVVNMYANRPIRKYDALTVLAVGNQTVEVSMNTIVKSEGSVDTSGFGVFADKDYLVDDVVETTVGFNTKDSRLHDYVFDFGIEEANSVFLKGNCSLINHSTDPNVGMKMSETQGMVLYAKKSIPKGSELLLNYGRNWFYSRS